MARDAPLKAKAVFEEQREAAQGPTGPGSIAIKSNAATASIFESSGNVNESIEVVKHMLQRAEMRPILEYLGYTKAAASDSMIVDSIAEFVKGHLSSGGTRSTDLQKAHNLLGKAAGSQQLLELRKVEEVARRLGYRHATFRHLIDCRIKLDAELEDGVEVGNMLKLSRMRRRTARDDDAECFDDWSHDLSVCRYDSTQTTGGKKVRRFGDAKVDGKVTFEEHERRALPCSRLELCKRFLDSDEYKAFLARKQRGPLHVSFFQKRICSCMVDEKMTQCADSIDTQFNVLLSSWVKSVKEWYANETCSKRGCVCKEEGFLQISSQKELWAFLFRGECAPEPDPTRFLPRDTAPHTQLRWPCVAKECDKEGCLKDKLERWATCPVQTKKGSETEMSSKKWTPVPRGKAKVHRLTHSRCSRCSLYSPDLLYT